MAQKELSPSHTLRLLWAVKALQAFRGAELVWEDAGGN